jgi:hypothetical protein
MKVRAEVVNQVGRAICELFSGKASPEEASEAALVLLAVYHAMEVSITGDEEQARADLAASLNARPERTSLALLRSDKCP